MPKQCACGTPISGKYRKKCNSCIAQVRRKKRKYNSTPQIDDMVTDVYMKRLKTRCSFSVAQVAAKIGWPKHAVVKRAAELGLARAKEKPWTQEEINLLHKNLWKSDARISEIFYAHGFKRSIVAIHLKIKRIGGRNSLTAGDYYTAHHLAGLFGLDSHRISAWIKQGWLHARMKGTSRPKSCGGDIYVITPSDVRTFIEAHPLAFDLRKVDQLWFMDLLLNRKANL